MTTIDQRILIPTSPEVVWQYISDIARNREWQTDCHEITFITSFKKGQGVRWRHAGGGRRDQVVEITAWYERMGYEYVIVDGASFKSNKGRLRLQETAEGTVLQWTFTYELGGLLSGMRDTISTRRNVENTIVDSLWTLWRNISQDAASKEPFVPKMLMREAPDVEARMQYKPRHDSIISTSVRSQEPSNPIPEPPVADDDTRPRPSVAAEQHIEQPAATQPPASQSPVETGGGTSASSEPDFLSNLDSPMATESKALFKPPSSDAVVPEAPAQARPEISQEPVAQTPEMLGGTESLTDGQDSVSETPAKENASGSEAPEEAIIDATQTPEPVKDQPESDSDASPDEGGSEPTSVDQTAEEIPADPQETYTDTFNTDQPETSKPASGPGDTSQVSVFELFGFSRPSDTQPLRPIPKTDTPATAPPASRKEESEIPPASVAPGATADAQVAAAQPVTPVPEPTYTPALPTGRIGFRMQVRRQQVKIRRPN